MNNSLVFPIQSANYEECCGFFIDHYFITSGHAITDSDNPSILVNGITIPLTNPIFFEDNRLESEGYDLAIFDIPSYNSNLELDTEDVLPGMKLKSISFKSLGTKLIKCDVNVCDYYEGNYFAGLTSVNLKSGSSGSPVLLDNKVVGVMTKGNNNGLDEPCNPNLPINFCLFLSAKAISKVL